MKIITDLLEEINGALTNIGIYDVEFAANTVIVDIETSTSRRVVEFNYLESQAEMVAKLENIYAYNEFLENEDDFNVITSTLFKHSITGYERLRSLSRDLEKKQCQL